MTPLAAPAQLRRAGFSLAEVVVALLILQLSALGAFGLFALSARAAARALQLERAAALAGWVADSLGSAGLAGTGSTVREGWELSWRPEGGGARLRVEALSGPEPRPAVELWVP